MQLPEYRKTKSEKLIICKEQGCGNEFYGHPIQKYCKFHSNPKNRVRVKKVKEDSNKANMFFQHHYSDAVDVEFDCSLEGCGRKYLVKVLPKLYVYPNYCEYHRNEFRRTNFLRANKGRLEEIVGS